jgi:repressor LexA
MWIQDVDIEVLNAINYLVINNFRISYRNIARQIWKLNSIRSVQLSIDRLVDKGEIYKDDEWKISIKDKTLSSNIKTRKIPLIWNIACWWPVLAEEQIEDYVPVAEKMLKKVDNYFLLRTSWDSMNKDWISPWDVVLVKQQSIANNGDIVVALIDDSATLKEFRKENGIIKLIPHSKNPENKTIIVTENLIIQWILEMNLGKI